MHPSLEPLHLPVLDCSAIRDVSYLVEDGVLGVQSRTRDTIIEIYVTRGETLIDIHLRGALWLAAGLGHAHSGDEVVAESLYRGRVID